MSTGAKSALYDCLVSSELSGCEASQFAVAATNKNRFIGRRPPLAVLSLLSDWLQLTTKFGAKSEHSAKGNPDFHDPHTHCPPFFLTDERRRFKLREIWPGHHISDRKLSDLSIAVARWHQQHRNGRVTLGFATHPIVFYVKGLFPSLNSPHLISIDLISSQPIAP